MPFGKPGGGDLQRPEGDPDRGPRHDEYPNRPGPQRAEHIHPRPTFGDRALRRVIAST
ncbi:hypothetical protein [Dactylosporangium darangshiense]|uniref:hypothetical protein n=1 Tax=Dactylosporangium darangshiense TaxID=579108 RepID=UPI003638BCDD